MKRTLGIVAAVTGYVVIEILLLLSIIVPHESNDYRIFVSWSQLLLIPGFAALFSRIIYGPQKWGRRTLAILLVALLGLCIFIIPLFVIAASLDWTFLFSKILFAVAMSVIFGAMVIGLRWCLRRLTRWNTESEVERWLTERQGGNCIYERKCRLRAMRVASLMPATAVLLVFLFLPEVWGLLSHLNHSRLGNLSGYQVTIPRTWIVFYQDNGGSDGRPWAYGYAGQGIALGGNPFREDAFSYWGVRTISSIQSERTDYDPWPPKADEIISRRNLATGNSRIECFDYWPSYIWGPKGSETTSIAHVECSDSTRIRASFEGSRSQLGRFYHMLESAKKAH